MSIETEVIVAISTVVGAGIGGWISLISSRRQGEMDALEKKYDNLERVYIEACQQIESFHKIEEAHSQNTATFGKKTEQQAKLEIRDIVEKAGGGRPSWSALDARKEIKRLRP
jgi:gas vesicle protein